MALRFSFLLSALTIPAFAQTGNEPRNVTALYGRAGLAVIRSPERVFMVLLNDDGRKIRERSRRVELSEAERKEASRILSANRSYRWEIWKPCAPSYGARLLFQRGIETVSIDLCFSCVEVTPSGSDAKVDFSPVRRDLVRLLKTAFPKDKVVRELE